MRAGVARCGGWCVRGVPVGMATMTDLPLLLGDVLNPVALCLEYQRLCDEYGYDVHSAREALNYVTTLLAQE